MRRNLCVLLVFILFISTSGCGEEIPQEQTRYVKPTFVPGIMEAELLAAEPNNFDRICDTGNGDYLEIETGYYVNWWGHLYYAESTDLDTWYFVCSDAQCSHGYDCSSFTESNSVWYSNGRIYFASNSGVYPHFFPKEISAMALFSMAPNGEDVRCEHYYEDFFTGGACGGRAYAIPGGYLLGAYRLLPSGLYERVAVLYTLEDGMQILHRNQQENESTSEITQTGLLALGLGGDLSVVSWLFDDTDYANTLCWFQNGEPVFTDISEIPAWGGYLQGSVIRCFDPGKGYFDVDLLTGERTELADAQLAESKARILQPNCIIETTLLNPEAAVETQEMRFFDGQQWHEVALPEELLVPNETFEVLALSSDRVIFTVRQRHAYDPEKDTMVWYCMKLGGETYTVEPMGTFQKPMGTGLADQP